MSFGMYKQGQGYWTRIMSAIGAALLVAGPAAWLWGEVSTVSLPNIWRMAMDQSAQVTELPAGTTIDLLDETGASIGSGLVDSLSETGNSVYIKDLAFTGTNGTDLVAGLSSGTFSATVSSATAQPIFEIIYVQGAVAAATLLLGAIIIYYLVYVKAGTSEFLIATEGEMKKVNWSTRREILGSTWVVIAISVIIAAILFVVDIGFATFFREIGVIEVNN